MDLFKAIFAESSEESDVPSDSEMEAEVSHPSEPSPQIIQSLSKPHETRRKTRWQDLSEVTNQTQPLSTGISTGKLAVESSVVGKQATGVSAAAGLPLIPRENRVGERTHKMAAQNGGTATERASAATERKPEVFGPILPPGN